MTSGKIEDPPISAVVEPPVQLTQPATAGSQPDGAEAAECRLAGELDGTEWDAFVARQPAANLGHAFAWRKIVSSAYGKEPLYLMAREKGAVTGILPLVHLRGPLTGNRLVSLPYLDQAGLLATTPGAREALWGAARGLARERRVKGIDLRSLAQGATEGSHDRATLVLPLATSSEALWKSFSPKVRNQVRKSEKEGLKTELAEPTRLDEFYRVFTVNMRDLGSPVHSFAFLEAVYAAFGPAARLYLTRDAQGRAVGGAVALQFRGIVTVPWASSLREVFSSCPNHSLYWRALSDAAASGAQAFDFGRSHVDSGTYKFKTQWGAAPHPLVWTAYDGSGNPERQQVYKPSEHKKITWIWSRLPLAITTWLGPRIRKQLSN